ncbi:MAG TPA: aromatic ring-hydroxylating dioxygenase subunit alpha [Mycobacteriales bacterium]|nr:aromatic ring-hydroxylating dioxygenase subunit alpha [Mycobacteriales bacterium]
MPALQPALPKQHYIDAASFRTEVDRVLAREWTCVGRVADLGLTARERIAVIDVLGESVLVASTGDGRLAAYYNVCRHRGSQLFPVRPDEPTPATRSAKAIRCPYHSWTYGLDGGLLRAPHTEDVSDFDAGCFGLHRVGVTAWCGFLFVHLTPDQAAPLEAELAEIGERIRRYPLAALVTGHRMTYDVAANWKLIAENYNECYHCAGVHPELCRLVPAFGHGGQGLEWESGIPHREGAWTFTTTGTSDRAPFADLDEDERVRHKGELVYPNLMLSLSADHVAAFTLRPMTHDRTVIDFELLFAAEEVARPGFDATDAAEFWDLVNRQDWAICESVQRGMSSRAYQQGWFAPMENESLDIRRWLLTRLAGDGEHGPAGE